MLTEVLTELRKLLHFDLLGFDTDNDSVFMNETVRDYCQITLLQRRSRDCLRTLACPPRPKATYPASMAGWTP